MQEKTSTIRDTLRVFWRFTRKRRFFFWSGTVGAGIATIIQDIIPPILIAKAFDRLQTDSASNNPIDLSAYLPYLYGYIGLMLLGVIIWRTQVWLVWIYELKATRDIVVHIFDHLQRMGSGFHNNRFGGGLVSQTNKFLSAYERIMDEFTWSIVTGLVAFLAAFTVLSVTYLPFAAIFAGVSVVYFVIIFYRTMHTMPLDRALASSESERTARLADTITNVSAVITYAGEEHEKKLFAAQADTTNRAFWRLLKRVLVNDSLSHGMTSSISIIAFAVGILAITTWNQPAGILFLAVNYTMQITRRLWESNRTLRNLSRSFGDANDMTAILKLTPEISDTPGAKTLMVAKGKIEFRDVDFSYPEQRNELLFDKLSLTINPGEKVGFVGHSGGGKTTITKLLLRLMNIDKGAILIDDQKIEDATQTSVRQAVAYVPQDPLLFHRSLADNIAYGRPSATHKEVIKAAKSAHAHEFISKLTEGYDTLVGERGVKLSGGQRQRIAIARAMLKDAPVLVLDEATSALDSESEALIQDALWKLMEGRTAIVIAHRLSTIQHMDRIVVLDNGRIIEQGTHKELLAHNGAYAKLWARQSGGFIED